MPGGKKMTYLKMIAIVALAATLSACGAIETATRNAPLVTPALTTGSQTVSRSYLVERVNFNAPESLSVSEANGYYPMADIVWRGDPVGDRYQQIGALFATAAERGVLPLVGTVPVNVEINLLRFHGVTERTRFSFGGNYNIIFSMTVYHAETGEVIEPTRRIVGNLPAPGGAAAILADQNGQTEKVRVTDFLTTLLNKELTGAYNI
jgi:hypothetical protein